MWTGQPAVDGGRAATPAARSVPPVVDDGLQVETAVLREAGAALAVVQAELGAAPAVADPPPQVLAHVSLRERLRHVGAGWDRRRLETAEAVAGLGQAAVAAAGTYERLETELARCLAAGP